MASSPRPGTLEWLADARPDEVVLITADGGLTRSAWEERADALAEHLTSEREVGPGELVTAAGAIGPDWFTVSWATAKLGAGLAGLPPGPVVSLPGATHLEAIPDGLAGAPRRLSATGALPDSVTFSRLGRPVRRSFSPGSVAAIGETLADLVARVGVVPGATLVVAGRVSDAVLTFQANIVLVGGGSVVSAPEPAAALGLAAAHEAESVALAPAGLKALAALSESEREALDLTTIRALVTGGAPLSPAARAVADDLFGADTIVDVYATADTGVVAVRGPGDAHHVLLGGVAARITRGVLEIRSPLAAAAGWVATGDRAALVGDAGLELLSR